MAQQSTASLSGLLGGNLLFCWKKHRAIVPFGPAGTDGSRIGVGTDWLAVKASLANGKQAAVIGAYWRPGEAAHNLSRQAELGRFVSSLDIPGLIGGDFNMTPVEQDALGWVTALGLVVVTPGNVEATCSAGVGRMLDYYMASPCLVHGGLE